MLVLIGNVNDLPFVSDEDVVRRIATRYRIPDSWAALVDRVAWSVGGDGMDLARVIWHESRFNPQAQFGYINGPPGGVFKPGRAVGLIQFKADTAQKLGTSAQELFAMPFNEQMRYVQRYLELVADGKWAGGAPGPLDTQEKMALAVFYPAKRNDPPTTPLSKSAQKANPGVRTIGDYVDRVLGESELAAPGPDIGVPRSAGYHIGAVVDQTYDPANLPWWLRLRTLSLPQVH